MNNKIVLMVGYILIFLISGLVFSKNNALRFQDIGQVAGLGSVVVGYFVTKYIKRK